MADLQSFVQSRRQERPYSQRQALASQIKVAVPPTQLGEAETQRAYLGVRDRGSVVKYDASQPVGRESGYGNAFDTDAESIEAVSPVTSRFMDNQIQSAESAEHSVRDGVLEIASKNSASKTKTQALSHLRLKIDDNHQLFSSKESVTRDCLDTDMFENDEIENNNLELSEELSSLKDNSPLRRPSGEVQLHPDIVQIMPFLPGSKNVHPGASAKRITESRALKPTNPCDTTSREEYDYIKDLDNGCFQCGTGPGAPKTSSEGPKSPSGNNKEMERNLQATLSVEALDLQRRIQSPSITHLATYDANQSCENANLTVLPQRQLSLDLQKELNKNFVGGDKIDPWSKLRKSDRSSRSLHIKQDTDRKSGADAECIGNNIIRPSYVARFDKSGNNAFFPTADESGDGIEVTRSDKHLLDYDSNQLLTMTFEELKSENFCLDASKMPALSGEIAHQPLAKRLAHMLNLKKDGSNSAQQEVVLSSLTLGEYKDFGDLITNDFSRVMTNFTAARQQRRDISQRYELEICRRERRVSSKSTKINKDLARLKRDGEGVVKEEQDGQGKEGEPI